MYAHGPTPVQLKLRQYQFEYMFLGQAYHQMRPGWQGKKNNLEVNQKI